MSRSPLYELTRARTLEFIRTPEAMFWTFMFPVLLALAIGFAFREKAPDRIPIGVLQSAKGEEALRILNASPALLPRMYGEEEGRAALRAGKISLLVIAGSPILYRFDPTRPDSRVARLEADLALQQAAGRRNPLRSSDQRVVEQGARYIDFLMPGLLGLNIMSTGVWGVGFSIVTARTRKLLKRLVATPMRRSEYLLAQILSRMLFLVFEVVLLVGFGWWIFGVAVHGSLALLGLVSVLGGIVFSGLGLLVASRAETIEGVSGLMNFVMLPMWLLSGIFFSADRFPDAVQPLIRALPLTALNDALRAIINEGVALPGILPELTVMTAWAALTFAVALKVFKWR
jgi:ABC-type multidrug transport system permease subunit